MTVMWWLVSRFFFMLGAIFLIAAAVDSRGLGVAACMLLMAVCAELYAQEDEHKRN